MNISKSDLAKRGVGCLLIYTVGLPEPLIVISITPVSALGFFVG
jgi:hypothetical protein